MRPHHDMRRGIALLCAALLTLAAGFVPGRHESAVAATAARRIVVIGATAKSARELLWQAIATGHEVTGIARDPARVDLRHERLRVVQGDVLDVDSIAAVLEGDEVVISLVGPRVDPMKEVAGMDLYTRGTANIISAMQRKGNRRLLVASSIGVENLPAVPKEKPAAGDVSRLWLWNSRALYADMKAMEDLVRASGLEYLIFRPAFILEEPAKQDLELRVDADSPKGRVVNSADLAGFLLDQVEGRRYLGRTVGLFSPRELKFGVTADFEKLSAGMAERAAASGLPAGAPTAAGEPPVPAPAAAARDASRGRELAATCVPCHGERGVSPSAAFPIIAGQQYDYLVSAMLAYLSGTRQDSIMGGAIRTLSRSDIEDLAAYFSAQRGVGGAAASGAAGGGAPPVPGAGPAAAGAPPAGALAMAQAAAESARALDPLGPRTRATAGDARELKRCATAPGGMPDGFAVDADGDGYLAICNAEQLRALSQPDPQQPEAELNPRWKRNYELVADLDLAGIADLQPIGNCGKANNCMISRDRHGFAGHFDGNGHAIRGLRVERPDSGGVGLFGTLARDGRITRLALRDAAVTGANGTGLLVGANFGRIADCDIEGRVQGRVAIGGVAGGNAGRIERVQARVDIAATAAVGGLVGDMNGVVTDSFADARDAAGGKGVGGLIGLSTFGTLARSRALGSVTGSDNVGGAVGVNTNALLAEVAVRVDVVATATNAGGLVGFNSQSLVRDTRASGLVRGANAVGGLVGRNAGAVVSSFANGKAQSQGSADALVGDNANGTIIDAFALAPTALSAPAAATARWDSAIWERSTLQGRLPRLRHLPAVAGPSEDAAGPRIDTMQPFAPGDVIVAATVMNDPQDDHAGAGRLLQYDVNLRFKGELWLKGTRHKVGGLTFGPDLTLWAMSQLTPAVVEVAPNGRQRPYRVWSERKLSSVTFAPDGTLYFGEHLMGRQTGHPSVTTKFSLLAGRDVIGDGHVFQFTRDGRPLREFATVAHGGLFGFLAVTSTVLRDRGRRLVYLSETSNVIKQYDLAGARQLPDLLRVEKDPDVPMLIVMNPMPDGRVLISTANGFIMVDPDSGQVLRKYRLDGIGWAAINAGTDNEYAFVGNFWTGEVVKVRLSDGAVVARANVQQRESLSGIAQFPG